MRGYIASMPSTSQRVRPFTESVIRRMTRVAQHYGAVNLAQGFPDFDPPQAMTEALARAATAGPHQYALTWGAKNYREALCRKESLRMGREIDPEREVTVTCGSTEGMMAAMMTACDPGDKVVIFSPFYENYAADAILCGAEPIHVALRAPDFRFDPDELRRAFEERPKAIVLCNPSNPCGRVFTREELVTIADLAEEFDAFVLVDEVYEHIVYAPHRHIHFATLPRMWERTLTVGSLSKTYSATGWRLGHVFAPASLTDSVRKVHDFLTVGAAAPLQAAAVAGLELPESYYRELGELYAEKRRIFLDELEAAGLSFVPPEGAYFVLVDVSEFGVRDDVAFSEWMAREVGVAPVPGSSFFREPEHRYVRFHFAKGETTLREAGRRLRTLRAKAATR